MDIYLAGELNGIETAARINAHFDIPMIYLTAYSDNELLQQAKITVPYGYLVKPIKERELFATIEVSLHRRELEKQLQWESEVNAALAEISKVMITPALLIEEIISITPKYARELTGSAHGFVSLIDPQTGDTVGHTLTDMMGEQCRVAGQEQAFPVGPDRTYPALWGHVLNTRRAFYTNSPGTHASSVGIPEGHIPFKNFLSAPAMIGDRLVGQVALSNSEKGYTDRDLEVVERLTDLYALALHRKQTEETLLDVTAMLAQRTRELSQRNVELEQEIGERKSVEAAEREQRTLAEALADTAAILSSTLDSGKVLNRILTGIEHVVPHDAAHIMLVEADDCVRIVCHKGYERFGFENIELGHRNSIEQFYTLKTMIVTGKPLIVKDVEKDPRWNRRKWQGWTKSYAGAPIISGDEVLGFLSVVSSTPDFFSNIHTEHLETFANQAAIAIRNARLYEQASELAAIEERQRLARDMHDVVSQTLFSASVMSEALLRILAREPERVRPGLLELHRADARCVGGNAHLAGGTAPGNPGQFGSG